MGVPVVERTGRLEPLGQGRVVRWRRLRAGPGGHGEGVFRDAEAAVRQPLAGPRHARRLRRLHRLQRQHQPFLCHQVRSPSIINEVLEWEPRGQRDQLTPSVIDGD